jgi:hypothetical protein
MAFGGTKSASGNAMSSNDGEGASALDLATTEKLHGLQSFGYYDLLEEWRRLFRAQPPKRIGRDLLILGISWKIQEQAYGGHRPTTKRRLNELWNMIARDGDVTRDRVERLKPGAKLVREWRNQTHTVIVLDDSFEWQGKQWRSLTAIARAITGTHWSGPRFFALTDNEIRSPETDAAHAG